MEEMYPADKWLARTNWTISGDRLACSPRNQFSRLLLIFSYTNKKAMPEYQPYAVVGGLAVEVALYVAWTKLRYTEPG